MERKQATVRPMKITQEYLDYLRSRAEDVGYKVITDGGHWTMYAKVFRSRQEPYVQVRTVSRYLSEPINIGLGADEISGIARLFEESTQRTDFTDKEWSLKEIKMALRSHDAGRISDMVALSAVARVMGRHNKEEAPTTKEVDPPLRSSNVTNADRAFGIINEIAYSSSTPAVIRQRLKQAIALGRTTEEVNDSPQVQRPSSEESNTLDAIFRVVYGGSTSAVASMEEIRTIMARFKDIEGRKRVAASRGEEALNDSQQPLSRNIVSRIKADLSHISRLVDNWMHKRTPAVSSVRGIKDTIKTIGVVLDKNPVEEVVKKSPLIAVIPMDSLHQAHRQVVRIKALMDNWESLGRIGSTSNKAVKDILDRIVELTNVPSAEAPAKLKSDDSPLSVSNVTRIERTLKQISSTIEDEYKAGRIPSNARIFVQAAVNRIQTLLDVSPAEEEDYKFDNKFW